MLLILTILAAVVPAVLAGENKWGVGKLPALGWNSWNAYRCDITEDKFMSAAEKIVELGLREAGYVYVNIDDCWSTRSGRDTITGRIRPDLKKFPSGIDGLAKKVHHLGLKIGIYSSAGAVTCEGYPASLGHEDVDVKTWAEWGIDYLKYDNCGISRAQADECKYCQELNITTRPCGAGFCAKQYDFSKTKTVQRFNKMRDAIAASERPMIYSLCQWGEANVATWGNGTGQSWRTTTDVTPTWRIVKYIINRNSFTLNYVNFWGHSDADMLEVGNGGLTLAEERTHFALWAAMKSPLLMGTDLAKLRPASIEILKNKYLLAFNQDDVVGEPAKPYKWGTNPNWTFNDTHPPEYWSGNSKQGVLSLIINVGEKTVTKRLVFGAVPELKANGTYRIVDVWDGKNKGCFSNGFDLEIGMHDTSVLILKDDCGGEPGIKEGKLGL